MSSVLAPAVSIAPVFLFLGALVLIDSYKLVGLRAVLVAVAAGTVAALIAYAANVWLRPSLGLDLAGYSKYVAPVIEEALKAAYLVYLLARNKVGFVVDAAILGFGIGTGFAFVENVYYLRVSSEATIWTWIVRGFGTAIMHGGATAILAMVTRTLQNRTASSFRPCLLLPGLVVAVVLHSLYNQFILQPLLATALIMLVFPYAIIGIFQHSEKETRAWLGSGFDTDQELLRAMRLGQTAETAVGQYLTTLRSRFSPEVIVDMLCLLRLRAELGIRAKGLLMIREAGFDTRPPDPAIRETFAELKYLEKSIGRTGMLALSPFMHTSTRDLWELNMLDGIRQ